MALADDAVHVWRAGLDLDDAGRAAARATLTDEERARADRYLRPILGHRWTAARAFVRDVLAGYLGERPDALRFTLGAHGKPVLTTDPTGPHGALHFNVSHSGDVALLAVTRTGEVGVDVEEQKADLDLDGVARFSFAPEERAVLAQQPPADRAPAFYACWSRKEAYIKAIGLGLAMPLDAFVVTLAPHDPPALLASRLRPGDVTSLALHAFTPKRGYEGALAVSAAAGSPAFLAWQPREPVRS